MHTAAIDYCKGSDSLLTNVTGTITNQLQEGVQRVFMIALWTDSNVASFPGCVRGEKVAWYRLLAHVHAYPFPEKPGNPCTL